MAGSFRHIAAIAAILTLFLTSCGGDRVKVIPRDELAQIYAEMMMTDQWIINTPNVRLIADTSLVYEPILEKYGYDSDDYRKSVDVYMDDPERFARILRQTGDLLGARLTDLEARKAEMDRLEEIRKKMEKFRPDVDFHDMFPYLRNEPYVHYHDSLSIEMDTVMHFYRMTPVSVADTLYEGVRMVIRLQQDTVSVVPQEPVDTLEAAPVAEPEADPVIEPEEGHVIKALRRPEPGSKRKVMQEPAPERIERID